MFLPRQYTIDEIVTARSNNYITATEARQFALDLFTAHLVDPLDNPGIVVNKDK